MMTSSTPGQLVADQLHPLEHTVLMVRRRRQRLVAVEAGVAEIGVGGEEHALMERLELALGLAPPLEPAEVVVGQPRLDLAGLVAGLGVAARRATASA